MLTPPVPVVLVVVAAVTMEVEPEAMDLILHPVAAVVAVHRTRVV